MVESKWCIFASHCACMQHHSIKVIHFRESLPVHICRNQKTKTCKHLAGGVRIQGSSQARVEAHYFGTLQMSLSLLKTKLQPGRQMLENNSLRYRIQKDVICPATETIGIFGRSDLPTFLTYDRPRLLDCCTAARSQAKADTQYYTIMVHLLKNGTTKWWFEMLIWSSNRQDSAKDDMRLRMRRKARTAGPATASTKVQSRCRIGKDMGMAPNYQPYWLTSNYQPFWVCGCPMTNEINLVQKESTSRGSTALDWSASASSQTASGDWRSLKLYT